MLKIVATNTVFGVIWRNKEVLKNLIIHISGLLTAIKG